MIEITFVLFTSSFLVVSASLFCLASSLLLSWFVEVALISELVGAHLRILVSATPVGVTISFLGLKGVAPLKKSLWLLWLLHSYQGVLLPRLSLSLEIRSKQVGCRLLEQVLFICQVLDSRDLTGLQDPFFS